MAFSREGFVVVLLDMIPARSKHSVKGVLAAALLVVGCGGEGRVLLEDPWILAPPRGSTMLAAYATIENGSGRPVTIERVSSPAFEHATLHRTVIRDGQARMTPTDTLVIPAGGRAHMAPGGLHVMLSGGPASQEAGDTHVIRFHLSDGGMLEADFVIRDRGPGESD